ncbi:MAG: cytochrome c maturation protein CcmE [Vitreoscilla sp.]|nr:cytochrome c maturation protein CcmE [Burkholderiales bacterium]MBP6337132.1 cytochrome c maturation protein CcmE [Vitreoscilla sp.]MBP6674199.1 cytochrome c maturation protein CcmE [Vitreoscilla sp.]
MTPRQKRFAIIGGVLLALTAATALVLNAFRSNMVFFFTPTQISTGEAPKARAFRLGGLVQQGSVAREGINVRFVVTDTAKNVTVQYQGTLPDLFKEGKGVVAQGELNNEGVFMAKEVLAKHDENYMPPEAAEALKRAGQMPAPTETLVAKPAEGSKP